MIVTIDTSILVRAVSGSKGPARRLIELLAADPNHVIALSDNIIDEVGKVLSYPRMQELYRLDGDQIREHLTLLRNASRIVEPRFGIPVILLDPQDDAILYTAVAANADILCVKDKHFYDRHVVSYCAREGIEIMDDQALLRLLG